MEIVKNPDLSAKMLSFQKLIENNNVNFLVENLSKVRATDHREIQGEIRINLEKFKNETIKLLAFINLSTRSLILIISYTLCFGQDQYAQLS